MFKYSFVVPVYNTSKYLKRCIDSLINQSYENFEIILVNDGSTDNSLDILKEYKKKDKRIKIINQKNQGLSMARNNGVKKTTADYILFVDSDDYIDLNTLEELEKVKTNPDLIRFQIVEEKEENQKAINETGFSSLKGDLAFAEIVKYKYRETAVTYAYKREFYLKHKFEFEKGKYHEDFGLVPYIIMLAESVVSIDRALYYYVDNLASIMNTKTKDVMYKKYLDTYIQYKQNVERIEKHDLENIDIFKSFLTNALLSNLIKLDKETYRKELNKLKKERIFDNLLSDTLKRKMKKIIVSYNPKLFYK